MGAALTRRRARVAVAAIAALVHASQGAAAVPVAQVEALVHGWVLGQPAASGLGVQVEVSPPEGGLPACRGELRVEIAPRAQVSGRLPVLVRCRQPAWAMSVVARVQLSGTIWTAARSLTPGTMLSRADLASIDGEVAVLPSDRVRDPAEVVGRVAVRGIPAGTPLALNAFREPAVIKAGERVRVLLLGPSFQVAGEGVAANAAAIGETVRLRLPDGRQTSGRAAGPGTVEIRIE